MTSRDYVVNEAEIPGGTLVDLFLAAVDRFGDHAAFRHVVGGELLAISYAQAYQRAKEVARGLEEMGLTRGDRVAILSENRSEWALADYGCLCAGVVDVPIYPTVVASQVAFILANSGVRLVFVSDLEQMQKVEEACREVHLDVTIVTFDDVGVAPTNVVSWSDLLEGGRGSGNLTDEDDAFRTAARQAGPEDTATILYTSGTTGQPKGVMLTHNNLHSNVMAAGQVFAVSDKDSTLSFLPLSHVFQRMADFLFFSRGCTIAHGRGVKTVAADLKIVQPTIVCSVPRLYEKVYNGLMEREGFQGRLVQWAREVGTAWTEDLLEGRKPTGVLKLVHALADRLVYRKVREGLGGRLRFFVSGGAPLEPAINKFFYGMGIVILEGYGLTETSPTTNTNTLEHFRIGTVGRPVPGTEIRIAEDGEVLVRGPQVMKGYYLLPEETAKALDAEGWFHTGDIGELDEDGFLRITDRKKDLIVTAGGKNIAPQPIENRLKTHPLVEQVVMVGDRRKFVALLVVPAFSVLESWARTNGVTFSDRKELLAHPRVHEWVAHEVLDGLADRPSYERPKKLALLESEFTIESGTLTPTQKVRRRIVQDRHSSLIDQFYEDANADRLVLVDSGGIGA